MTDLGNRQPVSRPATRYRARALLWEASPKEPPRRSSILENSTEGDSQPSRPVSLLPKTGAATLLCPCLLRVAALLATNTKNTCFRCGRKTRSQHIVDCCISALRAVISDKDLHGRSPPGKGILRRSPGLVRHSPQLWLSLSRPSKTIRPDRLKYARPPHEASVPRGSSSGL